MSGEVTKDSHKNIGKLLHSKSISRRSRKIKPRGNTQTSSISKKKLVDYLTNSKNKDFKRRSASNKKQLDITGSGENTKCENQDRVCEMFKRRRKQKRKRTNNKVEVDEAAKLQRRTRYLLIRMKIEQNLLDAYSTEGWKGQSREKIKPERELQKAKKQILKCKLGLRDALRQLDSLSSDGCIEESAIAPDGSVHHDNIHCAKCKLREAFPDNDIILCDGSCNCGYHQMCIHPPLLTENIPPGDQGWFCKYCICKTAIIDGMNAHLGTSYPNDSNWQDIFKVEATLPEDGDTLLNQEEWPSDDSGDDDYDPDRVEKRENSFGNDGDCSEGESSDDEDASSSYSLQSLVEEVFDDEPMKLNRNMGLESTSTDFIGQVSDSGSDSDSEFVSGRRQRRSVDYRKLYDEMFGKDALANEQVSEDEDWGPTNRKRREKESDAASTLMTLCETEEKNVKDVADKAEVDTNLLFKEHKRSFFRIPTESVEKLRLVFASNELPSRGVKEDLSKQLGLDLDKVNKWFKNARYLSLKTKKTGEDMATQKDGPIILKQSGPGPGPGLPKDETMNEILPDNIVTNVTHIPIEERTKKFRRRQNTRSPTNVVNELQDTEELHISTSTNKVDGDIDPEKDDTSLKTSNENVELEKSKAAIIGGGSEGDADQAAAAAAEAEMAKLCVLKTKLDKLQQQVLLLRVPNRKAKTTAAIEPPNVIFVPVAQIKEKP